MSASNLPEKLRSLLVLLASLGLLLVPAQASEADAIALSANIQAKHLPFGTLLDPVYASPTSNRIVAYTRCGDSALWTGAYLAAEAFRYQVTTSAGALANVKAALAGLQALAAITGDNRLARCLVPENSPYAASIQHEEAHNTIHHRQPWIWVDNTSRDQVVGVLFGLGVAYDLVDDRTVRASVRDLIIRLIDFVAHHQWSPNDSVFNTFLVRPEQLQMVLQLAHHVNSAYPVRGPVLELPTKLAVLTDVLNNGSYFKFNLDYMALYHLLRLQHNEENARAYNIVRDATALHQNAFFNMVDCALRGPNTARDAETGRLLDQWLQRPRRDVYVDLRKAVQVCGQEACQPVPVPWRPPTDFLWQRDPFQLSGGGKGLIESAGVDYLLPYWMARYYSTGPARL